MSRALGSTRAPASTGAPSDIQEQSKDAIDDTLQQALGGGLAVGADDLMAGAGGAAGRWTGFLDMRAGARRLAPVRSQRGRRGVPVSLAQVRRQRAEAWRRRGRRGRRGRNHSHRSATAATPTACVHRWWWWWWWTWRWWRAAAAGGLDEDLAVHDHAVV